MNTFERHRPQHDFFAGTTESRERREVLRVLSDAACGLADTAVVPEEYATLRQTAVQFAAGYLRDKGVSDAVIDHAFAAMADIGQT